MRLYPPCLILHGGYASLPRSSPPLPGMHTRCAKHYAVYFIAALLLGSGWSGCTIPPQDEMAKQTSQTSFRFRADATAGLNADAGWAGAINEDVIMNVEQPFRIRFEVEQVTSPDTAHSFRLQFRHNGQAWTDIEAQKFPYPQRERALRFELAEAGEALRDWRLVRGNAADINVIADDGESSLEVHAVNEPLLALGLHESPWEPTEIETRIRLSASDSSRAGIVFGYADLENYSLVTLDASGAMRVSRLSNGEETTIAEKKMPIATGQWLNVEIEFGGSEVEVTFQDGTSSFTADLGAAIPTSPFGLYVPVHGSAQFETFDIQGEIRTPRVHIIDSKALTHGEATGDLLQGSTFSFAGGAAVNLTDTTIPWAGANAQSEWEWPLVIRRFSDGASLTNEGDTLEFRMIYGGAPLAVNSYPEITATVPPRLLGGTFVETPGRIGPWEASNGDLYFIMEPAETYNVLMMVKSTDGGETWREVDAANRPVTRDLEGLASDVGQSVIHVLHQTSNEVLHHAFRTSDHPTDPDTWYVRDDTVATPKQPPTQVAALAGRSDGSIVGAYGDGNSIRYAIRSPGAAWGSPSPIETEPPSPLSGPQLVTDADDTVHLAYTRRDGTAWYRRIEPDGSLTPSQLLTDKLGTGATDVGSILPLVFISETNTVAVVYRHASGQLWERRISSRGSLSDPVQVTERVVVQNAVDSDQTGADAIADGANAHVLFIDQDTGSIYHTHRGEGPDWQPPIPVVENVRAQWVRGTYLTRGAQGPVYGFVYDAGSNGGTGMNRYDAVPLENH